MDNTILAVINTTSQIQAKPTTTTTKLRDHLLNYCATKQNVGLRYHASNMALNAHSDAAFIVAPEAKSHIAGFFFLQIALHTTFQNVPILVECKPSNM